MSTTNANLIRDALGLIGVNAETQNPTAEQTEIALRTLNEMMLAWKARGVDLEYFTQTEVSEDTPIPDDAIVGVKYGLAILLAPYFEMPVSPTVITIADAEYRRLLRSAIHGALDAADMSHLPGAGRWRWDINTDS